MRFTRILWGMIALGLAVRVAFAFAYYGQPYDQESFVQVREALKVAPFDLYDLVVEGHWNYPPGFLPWVALAGWLSDATGLAFHGVIQLAAIAADIAIAWLVQFYLGTRGVESTQRLVAAGLVLLGPLFISISGYHGQIDSVGILPAVLGFVVWERGGSRRALHAGLLLGVAIVIKTAPGLLILALLPHVSSPREGARLLVATAVIPLVSVAPFVLTDPEHSLSALDYASVGTAGGIGLLSTLAPNPLLDGIRDLGTPWNALWIGAVGLVLARYRPPPMRAAAMIWLALFVFGTGFYLNYLVLGLPFLLLDGALLTVAAVQVVLIAPLLVTYAGLFGSFLANRAFDVPMLALWVFFAALLVIHTRAAADRGRSRASPPLS